MLQLISSPAKIHGTISVPGDKSISHRASIFNSIAQGEADVYNYSPSADCTSTLRCLKTLGVAIKKDPSDPTHLHILGAADRGLIEPQDVLNAGNSGTTMRLLTGVLAAQPFVSIITGDSSLKSRPMGRVTEPLSLMGANIWGRGGGSLPPLAIQGGHLKGIEYSLPVASAQVKSSILLAGLFAGGETLVHEPTPSRDHTELMLQTMNASIIKNANVVSIRAGVLRASDFIVPGDISAAAYWLVAGAVHPNAQVTVKGVGVNPTRTGILDALTQMGARVRVHNRRDATGEPVADISVQSSTLYGIELGGDIIPRIIDELPVLAVAACFAKGTTIIRDATELRVKESDRIETVTGELSRMGGKIRAMPDGMVIEGTRTLHGARVKSHGDHRLAMALTTAGILAQGETTVQGTECAAVSHPFFYQDLARLIS